MKPSLHELMKKIEKIEEIIEPKPKLDVRLVLDESEIDESLEDVVWVIFSIKGNCGSKGDIK
jgi:hypothetical protein